MSTRKRRRDSLTAHSPKEDEDELSPSKTAGHRNAPLSTIKRRKLNIPSDPTAHSSILSKGLQLLFGSAPITGKGKEDIYEVDELAMGHEEGHVEHRHTGANRDNDDIWEVPDDDAATRRGIDEGASKSKSGKGSSKKASMAILEMIDAADQKEGMREKTAKKASSAKSTPKSVNKKQIGGEAEITPKRSVGRPKKEAQSETKEAANSSVKKVARKEATSPMAAVPKLGRPRTSDVLKKAKELSRAAIRNRLSAHGQDESDEEETEAAHTPTKRKRSQGKGGQVDVAEDTTETEATMDTDMSGLKGKPKNNNLEISTDSPRGILTPTKRGVARPRKSVAFEGTGEIDLGFKDIPSPANTTPGKPKRGRPPKVRLPEVKSLEEHGQQIASKQKESVERTEGLDPADSDDEACEVCKRYDSKKPNQIIFCDGCDYAAHQICAGVPQIPKGSWFCKVCLAEQNADLLDLHSDDEDATAEKMDIPDITGFEDHLRDMQRLLLDKLTGQRRVKLRGQDDEMQKVHQVVEQTVLAGEGNSMLIIGARGSGKTTVSFVQLKFG
jgi:origin recognition complex subunit 4